MVSDDLKLAPGLAQACLYALQIPKTVSKAAKEGRRCTILPTSLGRATLHRPVASQRWRGICSDQLRPGAPQQLWTLPQAVRISLAKAHSYLDCQL